MDTQGERVSLSEYCLRYGREELLSQWHSSKNGELCPEKVSYGSHKKVWWQCSQGHEWEAVIKSRVEGRDCPVCAKRSIVPGVNDLATTEPGIADQWHPTKNGALLPTQVASGSRRKVWWLCECGYEWKAPIHSRMRSGCPACGGKVLLPGKNDLHTVNPEIARQWNTGRNRGLAPAQVSALSNRRVWWQCEKGHEWQANISARVTRLSGCPYCSNRTVLPGFNDLETRYPLIAAQWHPEKNGELRPGMVTAGAKKRVWWKCSDGHEWKAMIYSRTGAEKCGCPICAGRRPRKYD